MNKETSERRKNLSIALILTFNMNYFSHRPSIRLSISRFSVFFSFRKSFRPIVQRRPSAHISCSGRLGEASRLDESGFFHAQGVFQHVRGVEGLSPRVDPGPNQVSGGVCGADDAVGPDRQRGPGDRAGGKDEFHEFTVGRPFDGPSAQVQRRSCLVLDGDISPIGGGFNDCCLAFA